MRISYSSIVLYNSQLGSLHSLPPCAGEDIARDVASGAREVIMSAKTWMKAEYSHQRGPFGVHGNMYRRPWPQRLCDDGSVLFEDGSSVADVDVVMFCTGAEPVFERTQLLAFFAGEQVHAAACDRAL